MSVHCVRITGRKKKKTTVKRPAETWNKPVGVRGKKRGGERKRSDVSSKPGGYWGGEPRAPTPFYPSFGDAEKKEATGSLRRKRNG